ncbi:hypothetical protein N7509_008903 [Penicillium cosmopolitanum]|uniref:Invertebrate defensins family profile domain-containing protein n=1 Tax=Penicillium cosmopolitanum TaxID=1131564 RepID=A0A9X0B347_9EURO|nr:uncharacterized protein N7509_008903 [Penicillium cosmopolitanum]KAJ5386362.1 hypothetical protein N7509_008903 [Penicillium cosmopolitanum]
MQFSKITTSAVLFALSTMAIAAPSPNPLEARMNDLEARTEKLAARAGWTCAFGGDKACQVKCVGEGRAGGYCADNNVCTCIQ